MKKLIIYILDRVYPEIVVRPMANFMMKQNKKDLIGLEIGVYRGEHSYNMIRLLDVKKLFLVDPYLLYEGNKHYDKAKSVLRKWRNKTCFIIKKSEDISDTFNDNYFDFVYIDDGHDYESVKRQICLYYPKVKKGGILGGHDFCVSCPDVCRAVIEFTDKKGLKFRSWDKDWWITK